MLSCRDGAGGAVAGAVCADRAILSEVGQWPAADRDRADAAHLFFAAVVQFVGPGGGGGALRFVCDAPLCRNRSRLRAGARRDDGVPLPLPARGTRSGRAAVRRSAATLGGEG